MSPSVFRLIDYPQVSPQSIRDSSLLVRSDDWVNPIWIRDPANFFDFAQLKEVLGTEYDWKDFLRGRGFIYAMMQYLRGDTEEDREAKEKGKEVGTRYETFWFFAARTYHDLVTEEHLREEVGGKLYAKNISGLVNLAAAPNFNNPALVERYPNKHVIPHYCSALFARLYNYLIEHCEGVAEPRTLNTRERTRHSELCPGCGLIHRSDGNYPPDHPLYKEVYDEHMTKKEQTKRKRKE